MPATPRAAYLTLANRIDPPRRDFRLDLPRASTLTDESDLEVLQSTYQTYLSHFARIQGRRYRLWRLYTAADQAYIASLIRNIHVWIWIPGRT